MTRYPIHVGRGAIRRRPGAEPIVGHQRDAPGIRLAKLHRRRHRPLVDERPEVGPHLRLDGVISHPFQSDVNVDARTASVPIINPVQGNPTTLDRINASLR